MPRRSHTVRIRSVFSHSAQAVAEGALISLLVVGLMAGSAFAAKGGVGGGGGKHGGASTGAGTLALVMVKDANGNGAPDYGDAVTFNVAATVTYPWVHLACDQNGTSVFGQDIGFYAGYPWSQVATLTSYKWPGGAAACTARLYDSST